MSVTKARRTTIILAALFALCVVSGAPASFTAQGQTRPVPDRKPTLPSGAVVAPPPLDSSAFLGTVAGGVYTNDFFALRFDVPQGWDMHQPDAAFRREIAAQASRVTPLVVTGPVPSAPRPRGSLPFVVCVTEYLPGATDRITAREFYERMRRDRAGRELPAVIEEQVWDEQIGGRAFVAYGTRERTGVARQQNLVTVVRGFALVFRLNYVTDEDLRMLRELLPRIKFTT